MPGGMAPRKSLFNFVGRLTQHRETETLVACGHELGDPYCSLVILNSWRTCEPGGHTMFLVKNQGNFRVLWKLVVAVTAGLRLFCCFCTLCYNFTLGLITQQRRWLGVMRLLSGHISTLECSLCSELLCGEPKLERRWRFHCDGQRAPPPSPVSAFLCPASIVFTNVLRRGRAACAFLE